MMVPLHEDTTRPGTFWTSPGSEGFGYVVSKTVDANSGTIEVFRFSFDEAGEPATSDILVMTKKQLEEVAVARGRIGVEVAKGKKETRLVSKNELATPDGRPLKKFEIKVAERGRSAMESADLIERELKELAGEDSFVRMKAVGYNLWSMTKAGHDLPKYVKNSGSIKTGHVPSPTESVVKHRNPLGSPPPSRASSTRTVTIPPPRPAEKHILEQLDELIEGVASRGSGAKEALQSVVKGRGKLIAGLAVGVIVVPAIFRKLTGAGHRRDPYDPANLRRLQVQRGTTPQVDRIAHRRNVQSTYNRRPSMAGGMGPHTRGHMAAEMGVPGEFIGGIRPPVVPIKFALKKMVSSIGIPDKIAIDILQSVRQVQRPVKPTVQPAVIARMTRMGYLPVFQGSGDALRPIKVMGQSRGITSQLSATNLAYMTMRDADQLAAFGGKTSVFIENLMARAGRMVGVGGTALRTQAARAAGAFDSAVHSSVSWFGRASGMTEMLEAQRGPLLKQLDKSIVRSNKLISETERRLVEVREAGGWDKVVSTSPLIPPRIVSRPIAETADNLTREVSRYRDTVREFVDSEMQSVLALQEANSVYKEEIQAMTESLAEHNKKMAGIIGESAQTSTVLPRELGPEKLRHPYRKEGAVSTQRDLAVSMSTPVKLSQTRVPGPIPDIPETITGAAIMLNETGKLHPTAVNRVLIPGSGHDVQKAIQVDNLVRDLLSVDGVNVTRAPTGVVELSPQLLRRETERILKTVDAISAKRGGMRIPMDKLQEAANASGRSLAQQKVFRAMLHGKIAEDATGPLRAEIATMKAAVSGQHGLGVRQSGLLMGVGGIDEAVGAAGRTLETSRIHVKAPEYKIPPRVAHPDPWMQVRTDMGAEMYVPQSRLNEGHASALTGGVEPGLNKLPLAGTSIDREMVSTARTSVDPRMGPTAAAESLQSTSGVKAGVPSIMSQGDRPIAEARDALRGMARQQDDAMEDIASNMMDRMSSGTKQVLEADYVGEQYKRLAKQGGATPRVGEMSQASTVSASSHAYIEAQGPTQVKVSMPNVKTETPRIELPESGILHHSTIWNPGEVYGLLGADTRLRDQMLLYNIQLPGA